MQKIELKLDNPHFPSLRSDPMALSGASRRKQTPCSLLTWVCLGSLFLIAAAAPAFGGLTLTLNEEARTYTLSGSATGSASSDSFGGGVIEWDNFAAGNWNNSESLLTSTDFTVSGNTLKAPPASQGFTIYDTGNVSGLLQLNNAGTTTLTGTAQANSYSTFRTDIQAHLINLARASSGGGTTVPTISGSSAFDLLITSTFDPTPRGALYVNVNTTTKTYYVSGSATGSVSDSSGIGVIEWDNFAAGTSNNSESFLTSEAFTVGGNVLISPAIQGIDIYDTGNVSGLLQLHVAVDTTLTGNTAHVYDYSGFDSGIASRLELMAANGDTLQTSSGGSQFGLQFVSVPEPSTWMMFASALAIGCGRRRRTMPDTFHV